jgi:UDP-N-acetylmuramoyl-L-alanyl-D-glutamate--2,6-diaminopimelate ligase
VSGVQALSGVSAAVAWLAGLPRPAREARTRLVIDSRRVQPGDVFIAWPGAATDGRAHVAAALQAGAVGALVEADGVEAFGFSDARIATLPGLKAAAGPLAAAWQGQPATQLDVVAVTGTNGKSSTAWWTAQALTLLGRPCDVVGTLGIGQPPVAGAPGQVVPTGLTTPDPVTLQAAFAAMVAAGTRACAIEASSIGIAEHRLAGTPVAVAQFTNFTRDHLDYHGDMAAYWATKRALFNWPGLRAAVINTDDAQGAQLAAELAADLPADLPTIGLDLWPVAVQRAARLRAEDVGYVDGGLVFTLAETAADGSVSRVPLRSTLIGDYNAHNLLGVLGALRALGVPLADAAAVVPGLTPVPGRMDRVAAPAGAAPAPEVVVDYAHTPDALEKALAALQPLTIARGGRLWCVFGCGGNRDATKRPLMGAIARRMADQVVLTSDNPRLESPALILAQIMAGLCGASGIDVIEDRRGAIHHAIRSAAPQDVVLLAGKGHEDTQDVGGRKLPFLDAEVARQALAQRGGHA